LSGWMQIELRFGRGTFQVQTNVAGFCFKRAHLLQSRSDLVRVAVGLSPRRVTVNACVAERRLNPSIHQRGQASLRDANNCCNHRGLKPTATVIPSLREADRVRLEERELSRTVIDVLITTARRPESAFPSLNNELHATSRDHQRKKR
jgi:hypothetical protein